MPRTIAGSEISASPQNTKSTCGQPRITSSAMSSSGAAPPKMIGSEGWRAFSARQQLLKHQRKSHQAEAAPVDAVDAEIDESRRRVIAKPAQVGERTASELADGV